MAFRRKSRSTKTPWFYASRKKNNTVGVESDAFPRDAVIELTWRCTGFRTDGSGGIAYENPSSGGGTLIELDPVQDPQLWMVVHAANVRRDIFAASAFYNVSEGQTITPDFGTARVNTEKDADDVFSITGREVVGANGESPWLYSWLSRGNFPLGQPHAADIALRDMTIKLTYRSTGYRNGAEAMGYDPTDPTNAVSIDQAPELYTWMASAGQHGNIPESSAFYRVNEGDVITPKLDGIKSGTKQDVNTIHSITGKEVVGGF